MNIKGGAKWNMYKDIPIFVKAYKQFYSLFGNCITPIRSKPFEQLTSIAAIHLKTYPTQMTHRVLVTQVMSSQLGQIVSRCKIAVVMSDAMRHLSPGSRTEVLTRRTVKLKCDF